MMPCYIGFSIAAVIWSMCTVVIILVQLETPSSSIVVFIARAPFTYQNASAVFRQRPFVV